MSMEDAIFELTRAVGRIEADVAAIKTDVAELKAVPAKKSARRWQWFGGFVGLAGLVAAFVKLLHP
jgi:hypothetical protein